MKSSQVRNSMLLMLTALIWGIAFVAQSEGGDAVGPFSFNCIRFLIGGFVLIPVIRLLDALKLTGRKPETKEEKRTLLIGGISCGCALFAASATQQLGITMGAAAGKAGFLTACYILLVPVFGIFLKKKCGWNIWIGIVLALAGMYLLCMSGTLRLQVSDIMLIISAGLFAVHILVVDHFSPLTDGVRMSCIQFFVSGMLGLLPMIILEIMGKGVGVWCDNLMSPGAWISILYAGVLSCGVAYTLQIVGQDGMNPTVASLIMSLESVFSVIAGWILLNQKMGVKELCGCALIFTAIVFAQIPFKER